MVTDYQPLKWLMTNDKLLGKLAQWAFILQEYKFDVMHRHRMTHQNVDTLSHHPLSTCDDNSKARADHNPI